MGDSHRVEVVRGRLSDERAQQLLALWSAHGALAGEAARRRLPQVVALLLDDADGVVGACSVFADSVPLIGGRRFWMYRRFVAPGVPDDAEAALLLAAIGALEDERGEGPDAPLGVCVVVDDVEAMRRRPEAIWPDTLMFYAGYLPDGSQVRIRYFADARIA